MLFGNGKRRPLYEIGGVNRRGGRTLLADDKRKVVFGAILANSAMYSVCFISLCGTNAAIYKLHFRSP
jgi:hypothetical protein